MEPTEPAYEIERATFDMEPLHVRDWLWKPTLAKLWWLAIPIFWIGWAVALNVPALDEFYDTIFAHYMAIACNPAVVTLILGFGFVRAKLDRGEWVIVPDVPEQPLRPGAMLDPYTDPTDPRSGPRHLSHIGVLED